MDSLPIIVGINRKDKGAFAHMVPSKGHDAHAIKMVAREIKLAGYNKLILKSDQEPSIKELIEAVKRERSEKIEIQKVEIQCEESPVGEHKSNGDVEIAIQHVRAQIRTMRLGLQARYQSKIRADHPIAPIRDE